MTIAGLFWLKEGDNTVGTDPSNKIVLPEGSAPEHLGTLRRSGDSFTFRYADSSKPPVQMKSDAEGSPTMIRERDLTFWVINRGDRAGLRLRDLNSRFRKSFTGRQWYPVKAEYRIEGRLRAHSSRKRVKVPSVIGVSSEMESPGYVEFPFQGQTVRLLALSAGDSMWFILRDGTSGKSTYGAGRFLYADAPKDGKVILDFNRAYNPPCSFTPYATCPLPPKENRLDVSIEAGEKTYHHDW